MYLLRLLISIDQLVNTILGGQPDETISAKLYRKRHIKTFYILMKLVDTIFWLDPEHCKASYTSEVSRKYLPNEYTKE